MNGILHYVYSDKGTNWEYGTDHGAHLRITSVSHSMLNIGIYHSAV